MAAGDILRQFTSFRKPKPEVDLMLMVGFLLHGEKKVGINVNFRRMQMELRHIRRDGTDIYTVIVAYDACPNMTPVFRATFADSNVNYEYLMRGVWEPQLESWFDMERQANIIKLTAGICDDDDQC